jgi:SAM-dependent methyltransferase
LGATTIKDAEAVRGVSSEPANADGARRQSGRLHDAEAPVFDLERAYADCHDIVLSLALNERPGRALDLAAGQGRLSYALRSRGFEVEAAEIHPAQFKAPGIPCHKLNLNEKTPFADESFDLVLAVEILEHLEAPRAFLREIHRLLKPGGLGIVTTPNLTSLPSRLLFLATGCFDLFVPFESRLKDAYSAEADGHISPIPAWLLRYFLKEQGLAVEAERYTMAYLPLVPRAVLKHFRGRLLGRCGIWAVRKAGNRE